MEISVMNNHDILVSIIVPIYGTELYLSACIDSLCNQTYTNIQIVLVDDQSPDGCSEICDAYVQKDSRIQVVHQPNKGVSGARNTGMSVATGDYIMFVDSDDELYPNAVEVLLNDSLQYDADIVSATSKVVDEKGTVVFDYTDETFSVIKGDEPLLLSLQGDRNTEAVWAKLFKANFVKDLCFVEGKNINEDGYFMFQCYVKKPVVVQHNLAVYRYNIRQDSCSRQIFSDKYLAMLYFLERKKEYMALHYPQYIDQVHNMEVRTNLFLLDILCNSTGKRSKELQKQCIKKVRELYVYHVPIHKHHKQLAWIVVNGLYSIYKLLIRLKNSL
jgi:glycosyltransferase involved in cell wall biosynthesis